MTVTVLQQIHVPLVYIKKKKKKVYALSWKIFTYSEDSDTLNQTNETICLNKTPPTLLLPERRFFQIQAFMLVTLPSLYSKYRFS